MLGSRPTCKAWEVADAFPQKHKIAARNKPWAKTELLGLAVTNQKEDLEYPVEIPRGFLVDGAAM